MSADEEIEIQPMLGEEEEEQAEENLEQNVDENMEENFEDVKENENEDEEDEDSDDDIVVTIGDIKPNVPTTKRGFQVQKLDPNVTPTVNGKNIFDMNPSEFDEKPWLKSGANIADYFNFGFTEETWNEYAEKQRLLRLEYPTQAEINKIIMDELKEKHGNKELHIPVVMPVYNTGGRNLVTVQNVDKPPVKIGFDTPMQQQPQPIMRTVLTQPTTGTAPQNIGTINLTGNSSSQGSSQPEKIVVDLTKPPPNFNMPPPGQDGDKNESGPPGTFNPNVPPPGIRMQTTNLNNFNRPPMNMFNRPPMGNFYNPMGMMGGPGMVQHGRMPLMRNQNNMNGHDEAPPGVGSNRQSVDAPPGLDNFGGYSGGRDRERDRGRGDRDRRRDSDGSDEERRRRRRDRERGGDDRRDRSDRGRGERERERDRDRDSSRKRRDSPERSSSRRDRDDRKRSGDRDERESDRKRRRDDKDDRDRHRRRERSPSKTSKNADDNAGDDRPPGV